MERIRIYMIKPVYKRKYLQNLVGKTPPLRCRSPVFNSYVIHIPTDDDT